MTESNSRTFLRAQVFFNAEGTPFKAVRIRSVRQQRTDNGTWAEVSDRIIDRVEIDKATMRSVLAALRGGNPVLTQKQPLTRAAEKALRSAGYTPRTRWLLCDKPVQDGGFQDTGWQVDLTAVR